MKYHFTKLFQYESWANEQVIVALQSMERTDNRSLELFSHILAAHLNWYNRVKDDNTYIPLWEKRDLSDSVILLRQISKRWLELIEEVDELSWGKTLTYANSKGEVFQSSLYEIMTHLLFHSGYHRGQLVSNLKGRVETLPVTDFIIYTREGF